MLLALACTLSPHRRCTRHLSKLGSFFFFSELCYLVSSKLRYGAGEGSRRILKEVSVSKTLLMQSGSLASGASHI